MYSLLILPPNNCQEYRVILSGENMTQRKAMQLELVLVVYFGKLNN